MDSSNDEMDRNFISQAPHPDLQTEILHVQQVDVDVEQLYHQESQS